MRPRLSWIRSKPYSELLSELNDLINMERAYYEKSLSKVSYYETKGKIFENKAKSGHLQMDKIVTYLNKELFWEERRNRSEARLLTYIEFRDTLRELVKKTGT